MSAIVELEEMAVEEGTFVIDLDFTDEDGATVVPSSITWRMADQDNAVINGRAAESIVPAASVSILLTGDDLSMSDGSFRSITVTAVYDSTLGSGLIQRREIRFSIENLQGI